MEKQKLRFENEKLSLENDKLTLENENNKREFFSVRGLRNLLYSGNLSIILGLALALGGGYKYFKEQKTIRRKREEERFEGVVKSLGSQYPQERISAAVLLLTFLDPKNREYRRFHEQVFNLAAGHLRMRTADAASRPSTKIEIPGSVQKLEMYAHSEVESLPKSADAPITEMSPLPPSRDNMALQRLPDPLTQPLANVLSESYRSIRDALKLKSEDEKPEVVRRRLNGAGVRLEGVDLSGTDLRFAWLKQASLRGATLRSAFLANIILIAADVSEAILTRAELIGANLSNANFSRATLDKAYLNGSVASGANFSHASARGARFDGADLSDADLSWVDFGPAEPGGRLANPETALTLEKAIFRNVSGLTDTQRELCIKKGAYFWDQEEFNSLSFPPRDSSPPRS
ncbi:MAG: pentapeptide repeat-containing protein [Acidobacteriota bacterium]|nr:pentapeptide repeat-containing protein [Acidobacteriota bacterium]